MPNDQGLVIENQWVSWNKITELQNIDSIDAQIAVQIAGRRIKERLKLRHDPFRFRSSSIGTEFQAVGIAGTLALKEVSLDIVPKFVLRKERLKDWNTSTLFLLEALAGKHVTSLLAKRQKWRTHRVLDLIGHAFADAGERGLRDQPIQLYRHTEESASVLRGKLNLSRQLRNIVNAPHLLECDVDQLDSENPFNDVLKWAALVLAPAVYERDLKERLEHIAQALPGRPERSLAQRYQRLIPPAQFSSWTDALEIARLLASSMTMPKSGGRRNGYSLMFNMERAFERFVEFGISHTLSSHVEKGFTSHRQQWTTYAKPMFESGRTLNCRPDNVLYRNGKPIVVIDAKYKLLDDELSDSIENMPIATPRSVDIYELITGMIANGCLGGLLIYPSSREPSSESTAIRTWEINSFGTRLRIGAIPIPLLSLRSRSELTEAHSRLAAQIADFAKSAYFA